MKDGPWGSRVFPDSTVAIMLFYFLNVDCEMGLGGLGIFQTTQNKLVKLPEMEILKGMNDEAYGMYFPDIDCF